MWFVYFAVTAIIWLTRYPQGNGPRRRWWAAHVACSLGTGLLLWRTSPPARVAVWSALLWGPVFWAFGCFLVMLAAAYVKEVALLVAEIVGDVYRPIRDFFCPPDETERRHPSPTEPSRRP